MGGDVIYKDLSYQIIGISFDLYNKFGYSCREKYIQNAFEVELNNLGIAYAREKCINLYHGGQQIGRYFLDFVVDNKVIVEFKVAPEFQGIHLRQVLEYLYATKLKLAIIIYFTKTGVKYKRIVNNKII